MSRKMADDIERLRSMSEQMVRAEKLAATGTLAAGVAHEVNNPLASISSLIQILQSQPLTPENEPEAREMLRLVQTQVARITRVLRDMTEFARARTTERAPVDVRAVVQAAVRLASFDKTFKRLELMTAFDERAPHVLADADQLQQVFLNLLLNARDATPEGGRVEVRARFDEGAGALVVEVADTGCGIAPEKLPRVFDPFYSTKPSGTGLGLAVCYGIVTAHGGRIEVAPNNGRGTIVRVTLPAAPDAATPDAAPPDTATKVTR